MQHKWIEVNPRGAARVEPRAGHAAVLIKDGRFWALVGGGNNERGLSQCSILDLEEEWIMGSIGTMRFSHRRSWEKA